MKIRSTAYSLDQLSARRHDQLQELDDDDHLHYLTIGRHDVVERHPAKVIGDLPASKITSGRFPMERMPEEVATLADIIVWGSIL